MRKMYLAIPVIAIAAAALGGLYAAQPDRMTPDRVKKAVAAEEALHQIDAASEVAEGDSVASVTEEPMQVAQAEPAADTEKSDAPAGDMPDVFTVKFETSSGDFFAEFHKDWSPAGVERVWDLVQDDFFTDVRFFRVLDGFMAQFGIAADPEVGKKWKDAGLPSEEVKQSNTTGMISFAMAGRAPRPGWTNETRTTQLFINYADKNAQLDAMGFAPVGKVVRGMPVVERLFSGYGEGAPRGQGPDQSLIEKNGTKYLEQYFPKLDYIKKATVVDNIDLPEGAPAVESPVSEIPKTN